MKILFQPRIQNFLNPDGGGLKRQVLKTKQFLEKMGEEVIISLKHDEDLQNFDIVHLFSLDTYFQARHTQKYRVPVVLSPVYWVDAYFQTSNISFLKSIIKLPYYLIKYKKLARIGGIYNKELYRQYVADIIIPAITQHRIVLASADIWLPNGEEEYKKIVNNTGLEKECRVIPNAVDEELLTLPESPVQLPKGDYALCVAAITPRKNQLKLIKIADELGINLVLAGSSRQGNEKYYKQCRAAAKANTLFLGELNDSQLAFVYRRAKLHVLPSIYETPGLSSLEAALFSCQIVTTPIGAVYEYFGDHAFYCDPYDDDSIKDALSKAWNTPRNDILRNEVLAKYTWRKIAEMTAEVYERLIKRVGG
jgi:glycosyltransferase involved in cell wall biosynthesis